MTVSRILRIGTRGSKLACWQADWVAHRLLGAGVEVEVVRIETTGDVATGSLSQMGGVGVFTKEIQRAVLERKVDIAVHSLKDLPTQSTPGLTLAAIPPRATNCDTLVTRSGRSLRELPSGSCIGTGSLRRQAQLLNARHDLRVRDIRGNVETRLKKVENGDYDAVILAEAGLQRLGLEDHITQRFSLSEFLPAVGQGALGLEVREDDASTRSILRVLNDADSEAAVMAERSMLRELRAGCLAPVGAHAAVQSGKLHMRAVVLSVDGTERVDVVDKGLVDEPVELGIRLAASLLAEGAASLLSPSRFS